MHNFGVWYFETGWIFMTILGVVCGWFDGQNRKWYILFIFLVVAIVIGGLAAYGKYACAG